MLIGLKGIDLRIGATVLLDKVEFSLLARERVALVGRNGTGKSTLFRIIAGQLKPDDGIVVRADGLVVRSLEQEVPGQRAGTEGAAGQVDQGTVYDVVSRGFGTLGDTLAQYHHAVQNNDMEAMGHLQTEIENQNGWLLDSQVEHMLQRLQLDADVPFSSLSGGMKRRVMLAQALVCKPDVLLLDEPTNHLDIPSIEMLEQMVLDFQGAVLLISHDRSFVKKLATRVCDLDRGHLYSWAGGWDAFIKGKADALAAEEKQQALFDKKLAQEEVWIRKGVEARRTRSVARVKALLDMREQYRERRKKVGQAQIVVQEAERSGKLVMTAENLHFAFDGQVLVDDFSTVVMRGDKIGLIGPNGAGKSTLLKLLLGQLPLQAGSLKQGTKLEIAYFDQLRSQFSEEQTAVDLIGDGKEYIQIGSEAKHVMGYLQDFLFTPDRARQPVRSLSGGERARLLLAQMFSRPSNVLVLDEPTNDLDIETLDLLEEKLVQYEGTVLLVSHDREFLNQVVTRSWVFEGNGKIEEFIGGYDDWLRQRSTDPWSRDAKAKSSGSAQATPPAPVVQGAPAAPKKKLSYKEQRELESLPALIEQLEQEQNDLSARMADPAFYKQSAQEAGVVQARVAQIEKDLAHAYARWDALES